MTDNKGVGRPTTYYDIQEVTDIIEMKLKSIGNDVSKLTYNSVFKFNQYLHKADRRNYKNEIFTQYGYAFWAAEYKNIPNYGKEQIDLYKHRNNVMIAGDIFEVNTNDIETIIDNNLDNPVKKKKLLNRIFQNERKSNARNDKKFNEMQQEINQYKGMVKQYKEAIFMLFYNSRYSSNSLNDVVTLKNEGDLYIQKELYRIFNDDQALIDDIACTSDISNIKDINNELNNNILDMAKILSNREAEVEKYK